MLSRVTSPTTSPLGPGSIAVSTAWNAPRHAGWAGAARELVDLGFRGIALDGPALHPDAADAGRVVRAARAHVVALFAPAGRRETVSAPDAGGGLVSPREELRTVAVAAALAAADAANAARTGLVVVRPGEVPVVDAAREDRWTERLGREGSTSELRAEAAAAAAEMRGDRTRFLEALCRSLFALSRARPEVTWLLETPSTAAGLPTPAEAEHVFDDLRGRRLAWWHDPAHAARLGMLGLVDPGEWLARLGPRTRGMTISDWSPSGGRTPPGTGLVAWDALRDQASPSWVRVLRLEPEYPAALLVDAARDRARS